MTNQDPPIGPLRRLDPSEPDERDLGRLERLDPEAEETASARPADGDRPPSRAGSRLRGGLSAAITLAALLSLSSMAVIGGLVAVSMRTVAPSGPGIDPVDIAVPVTTIRVGESAQAAEEEPKKRPEAKPEAEADVAVFVPAPAPAPAVSGDGNGGGGKTDGHADGQRSGPRGVGGAWCDATEGTSCDAGVGGAALQPDSDKGSKVAEGDEGQTVPPGHSKHGP